MILVDGAEFWPGTEQFTNRIWNNAHVPAAYLQATIYVYPDGTELSDPSHLCEFYQYSRVIKAINAGETADESCLAHELAHAWTFAEFEGKVETHGPEFRSREAYLREAGVAEEPLPPLRDWLLQSE